ncbi:uncharacterized protein LOC143252251 isoform X1 [Tachypleus tridentatus]|uniref:uncharacterized protein LOC143252251 isoform X1 n=1 Tax=Tachypleus tridentatus TaxID=6853 RepID=UPI003FD5331B
MLKSKVSHLTFHRYFGQYNLQNESTQQPMKAGFESSRRQYLNMTGQRTLCTTCFVYIVNSEWSIHQFDSVSCLWWPFLALSLKYRMKSKFIINYLDNSRTETLEYLGHVWKADQLSSVQLLSTQLSCLFLILHCIPPYLLSHQNTTNMSFQLPEVPPENYK